MHIDEYVTSYAVERKVLYSIHWVCIGLYCILSFAWNRKRIKHIHKANYWDLYNRGGKKLFARVVVWSEQDIFVE